MSQRLDELEEIMEMIVKTSAAEFENLRQIYGVELFNEALDKVQLDIFDKYIEEKVKGGEK